MMEKLKDILNKYRFAVLVALAGVVLMLLPAGKQEIEARGGDVLLSGGDGAPYGGGAVRHGWRGSGAGDADAAQR